MIKTKIVTPEGVYREFETAILNVRSTDGQRGILPNHMPTVLLLEISRLETKEEGKKKQYAIAGGMLYFENNVATILVDSIESQEEIDEQRALAAKSRAEERLNRKDPNVDIRRAEVALHKAINRINVVHY